MNFGDLAGNLAGRVRDNINQQTPGGLIAKIGEVVAPALDDDEYEYVTDSEDGSYYEDYDEYEVDENIAEEEIQNEKGVEDESNEEEEFVFGDNTNGQDVQKQNMIHQPKPLFSDDLDPENSAALSAGEIESHSDSNHGLESSFSLKEDEQYSNKDHVEDSLSVEKVLIDHDKSSEYVDEKDNGSDPVSATDKMIDFTEKSKSIESNIDLTVDEKNVDTADAIDQTNSIGEASSQLQTEAESRMKLLLEQANQKIMMLEIKLQNSISDQKNTSIAQNQKQLRALYLADQKADEAMKKLGGANSKIKNLSQEIENLNTMVRKQKESAEILEREIKELKEENELLEDHIHEIDEDNDAAQEKIESLEDEKNKLRGLQMELHMVKEERDRDRAEIQSTVKSASSNVNKICTERDEARSQAQTAQQQLEATLADLEIMKSDFERLTLSNGNLQRALEAFQNERDAELDLLDEQRKNADMVQKAANDAKVVALREENEAKMREVQQSADMAVKNSMQEIVVLEGSVEVSS